LIKRTSLANQDGSFIIHAYRMLYSLRQHLRPVLCQKLWHYNNMCMNNDYFVNTLSTFAFQNISVVIHGNSILNEILFLILHLRIITWKWQEQGPLFQVRRGPKEFLKRHWTYNKTDNDNTLIMSVISVPFMQWHRNNNLYYLPHEIIGNAPCRFV
jgi:hypothetical protein